MTTNLSAFVSSGARMAMIIYLLLLLYSDITQYLRHISRRRQSSHYHYPGRIFHFIGKWELKTESGSTRRLKQDLSNPLKIKWMSLGFILPE